MSIGGLEGLLEERSCAADRDVSCEPVDGEGDAIEGEDFVRGPQLDGFTGHAESDLLFGGAMSTVITLALVVWCWALLKRGYKLKA